MRGGKRSSMLLIPEGASRNAIALVAPEPPKPSSGVAGWPACQVFLMLCTQWTAKDVPLTRGSSPRTVLMRKCRSCCAAAGCRRGRLSLLLVGYGCGCRGREALSITAVGPAQTIGDLFSRCPEIRKGGEDVLGGLLEASGDRSHPVTGRFSAAGTSQAVPTGRTARHRRPRRRRPPRHRCPSHFFRRSRARNG